MESFLQPDQDNGIIYEASKTEDPKKVDLYFEELAKEFTFPNEHILDLVISEKLASIIVLTDKGILYRIDGNTLERLSSKLGTEGSLGKISDNADR